MPSAGVVAGHGATVAFELLPVGSPGVFTVVFEPTSDLKVPMRSRSKTETTPHTRNVATYSVGYVEWGTLTFTSNYVYDNSTLDHLTGIQYLFNKNTVCGLRMRGPFGSSNTDEFIVSGQFISLEVDNPNKAGAPRVINAVFQPSGNYIQDGVLQTGT